MKPLGYQEIRPGNICRSHGGGHHVMVEAGVDARLPDTVKVDGREFRKVNYGTLSGQMYVETTPYGGYQRKY